MNLGLYIIKLDFQGMDNFPHFKEMASNPSFQLQIFPKKQQGPSLKTVIWKYPCKGDAFSKASAMERNVFSKGQEAAGKRDAFAASRKPSQKKYNDG